MGGSRRDLLLAESDVNAAKLSLTSSSFLEQMRGQGREGSDGGAELPVFLLGV